MDLFNIKEVKRLKERLNRVDKENEQLGRYLNLNGITRLRFHKIGYDYYKIGRFSIIRKDNSIALLSEILAEEKSLLKLIDKKNKELENKDD